MNRYIRQLALPEITPAHQKQLEETRIVMAGAGGLGAAALPALAAAGVGHIAIIDHDDIDRHNLHRQTIYQDDQTGAPKAENAAAYLQSLNPEIAVRAIPEKLSDENAAELLAGYDIIMDGTDNFSAKMALNKAAIKNAAPLISASVNQWQGQAGIYAGHAADKPCWHCPFPELPQDAMNCNEAGILGTSAGLAGMLQAHLVLCFLLQIDGYEPGLFLSLDFKSLRLQKLHLPKNESCNHCAHSTEQWTQEPILTNEIALIAPSDLQHENCLIVDVRTRPEIEAHPIKGAVHIEISELPARYNELPKDKQLAFACAANVRSRHAAEFMAAMGYSNICIYDVLAA